MNAMNETDNCWTHWSILTPQKEGKPDITITSRIQCNRKYTVPLMKYSCQTESESDQASRANYQFPRDTGIEGYIKLCLSKCNHAKPTMREILREF